MGANRRRSYGGTPQRPVPPRQATGHTFLILVEGEATELSYFEEVKLRLKRKAAAVIVHHGAHTDPVGMIREAIALRDKQGEKASKGATEPFDQVWVVFDRERQNHPRREQLPAALKLAEENGIRAALSVPSFEFWLLLHFDYTTAAFDGCEAVKKALKKFIRDYEKSDLPLDSLLRRVKTAMQHACQCRKHWESAGGDRNPSTDVDELLRQLNDSARANERLF